MKFIVSEKRCFVLEAEDWQSAIASRKTGAGDAVGSVKYETNEVQDAQPISRDQWPMWAKVLAGKSTPEDKGIGDVVARTIGPEASGAFKAFYEMTFGKPCGCNGRQKRWNIEYPLNLKAT